MNDDEDLFEEALAGEALGSEEAARLEATLTSDSSNVAVRVRLLGYYALRSYTDPVARRRKTAHSLWMIRHRADAEIAGSPFCHVERFLDAGGHRRAKALWDRHVASRSAGTAVLANAARFYTDGDKRKAASLYRRLQRLEPGNPDWRERLGHLLHLQSARRSRFGRHRATAARAFAEFEAALRLSPEPRQRFYLLTRAAPVAVDSGRVDKAASAAKELLRLARKYPTDWNYGNALHHAHSTLGRLALRARRVAEAKRRLLASAKTRGSPQLDSFGPSWELAAGLLARGETRVVLRYLELCRAFWAMGQAQLDAWTSSIRKSGTTDFLPVYPAPTA